MSGLAAVSAESGGGGSSGWTPTQVATLVGAVLALGITLNLILGALGGASHAAQIDYRYWSVDLDSMAFYGIENGYLMGLCPSVSQGRCGPSGSAPNATQWPLPPGNAERARYALFGSWSQSSCRGPFTWRRYPTSPISSSDCINAVEQARLTVPGDSVPIVIAP